MRCVGDALGPHAVSQSQAPGDDAARLEGNKRALDRESPTRIDLLEKSGSMVTPLDPESFSSGQVRQRLGVTGTAGVAY